MNNYTRRSFIGMVFSTLGAGLLTSCGKVKVEILDSVYKTAELNQNNTYFDDILASHEPIKLKTFHRGKESDITIQLIDASDLLEKSIIAKEILKNVDVNNYNPLILSEEEENKAIDLDIDVLKELVNSYGNSDNQAKNMLGYLKEYYTRWHSNNGLVISEKLLLAVLKNYGYQLDSSAKEVKVDSETAEGRKYIRTINNDSVNKFEIDNSSGTVNEILNHLYDVQEVLYSGTRDFSITDLDGSNRNSSDIDKALSLAKEGAIIEVSAVKEEDILKIREVGTLNNEVLDHLKIKHR